MNRSCDPCIEQSLVMDLKCMIFGDNIWVSGWVRKSIFYSGGEVRVVMERSRIKHDIQGQIRNSQDEVHLECVMRGCLHECP